ncbi:MAG: rhamnulokinase [Lentisphaeria bacterium]|nr:rhamnulokinase [Lentisphaeria bacterium]NQZ70593.1 rhamnulokinase [Lentisphaeria bacterium]
MKFLAVDLGASSGRTIVAELSKESITLTETHRFKNSMKDINGEKHWDVHALLEEIKIGIAASGEVEGIGIDTWGVDFGLLDADGNLLDLPFAYRDSRHEKAMPEVYAKVSKERLYEITGMQEMTLNSIFQIYAEKMFRPELLAKADRLLFIPELLAYFLTGNKEHEYSACSTSGLLDAKTRDWSDELLETLDLPKHIFGKVNMPGTKSGEYNGTAVYLPAMHDTGSAVASVPVVDDCEWAYLSSGTWSLIGAELTEPILGDAAVKANFTNEGGIDGTIRFLKNVNGLWLIQECQRIWEEQGTNLSFAEIAKAAEESSYRETFDPAGTQYLAPDNMPAEIKADLESQGKPLPDSYGDMARCCYESLAAAYKRELNVLQTVTGKTFERLYVVGGGAQATLLNQLTANALGIEVYAGPIEATAIGNVCVQAMANGLFKDIQELRQAIANSFEIVIYQPE